MLLHLGVFLITLSGLVFEVALTRIYSATIWYHFAFVAVSVALLGWGLGGFGLHLLKRRLGPSLDRAAVLALLYAAAIPACLGLLVRFPFTLERLPLYFVAPLVPFFLAGMALAMVFDLCRDRAGSLYFADLVGASIGALGVTFLLQRVGGETAILIAALAPCAAAACLSGHRVIRGVAAVGAAVVVLATASGAGVSVFQIAPSPLKAMRRQMDELPAARVAQRGWNAYRASTPSKGSRPRTSRGSTSTRMPGRASSSGTAGSTASAT